MSHTESCETLSQEVQVLRVQIWTSPLCDSLDLQYQNIEQVQSPVMMYQKSVFTLIYHKKSCFKSYVAVQLTKPRSGHQ